MSNFFFLDDLFLEFTFQNEEQETHGCNSYLYELMKPCKVGICAQPFFCNPPINT